MANRARTLSLLAALTVLGVACGSSGGGTSATTSGSGAATTSTSTSATTAAGGGVAPVTVGQATSADVTVGLPSGWKAEQPNATTELFVQHGTRPDLQLGVRSSPVANGEAGAAEYVTGQRATAKGYSNTVDVTAARTLDLRVGGETATTFDWTFDAKAADGRRTSFRHRRIILVHAGALYDVTFQAPLATFDKDTADLDVILRTWAFTRG